MIKFVTISLLTAATALSASAEGVSAPWLKVDGQINFDLTASDRGNFERNLRTQDAEIKFEILLKEGIKAVVKTELERALLNSGNGVMSDKFDVEQFVEEAYIQIETDQLGLPRAIITAGKHQIAFGQNYTQIPMFKDNLLYNLTTQEQVIGLTVQLPTDTLKIVDSIAISIFEGSVGDLKIKDGVAGSIKLEKQVTDRIRAQASLMLKENGRAGKTETRGSLGFVFVSGSGKLTAWAEGVIVSHNPNYARETVMGGRVGAGYKVGPGTVVIEYTYLRDQGHEVAAAYNLPVGSGLVLSPEVRHRTNADGQGNSDTIVGIRARLMFQSEMKKRALKGA